MSGHVKDNVCPLCTKQGDSYPHVIWECRLTKLLMQQLKEMMRRKEVKVRWPTMIGDLLLGEIPLVKEEVEVRLIVVSMMKKLVGLKEGDVEFYLKVGSKMFGGMLERIVLRKKK